MKLVQSKQITTSLSNVAFQFAIYLAANLVHNGFRIIQISFPSMCVPPSEVAVLFDSNLSRRPFLGQVAFHLRPIGLQTLVAIDSESRLTSFPSFCAPLFEVAVLFDSNLSRRPFLAQVVNLDLLLCTGFNLEHVVLFICHMFTQRPMHDRKIERSDRCALVCNNFSPIPSKISFHMKKKGLVAALYLQSIKTCLTVELSQYRKSGSTVSSSEQVAARSDCRRLGNARRGGVCRRTSPRGVELGAQAAHVEQHVQCIVHQQVAELGGEVVHDGDHAPPVVDDVPPVERLVAGQGKQQAVDEDVGRVEEEEQRHGVHDVPAGLQRQVDGGDRGGGAPVEERQLVGLDDGGGGRAGRGRHG